MHTTKNRLMKLKTISITLFWVAGMVGWFLLIAGTSGPSWVTPVLGLVGLLAFTWVALSADYWVKKKLRPLE